MTENAKIVPLGDSSLGLLLRQLSEITRTKVLPQLLSELNNLRVKAQVLQQLQAVRAAQERGRRS